MTTQSGYFSTSGAGTGNQVAEYNQALEKIANAILAGCSNFEGVAPGFLNALEGTVTGYEEVQIDTGGAVVDGLWFYCSAAESVTIPSATAGNTRIDRIVLRADWANFNVSIHRIAGTDSGSPTAPAITQTAGTTYDIMLYQALVDAGGTVTLTDERVWAKQDEPYKTALHVKVFYGDEDVESGDGKFDLPILDPSLDGLKLTGVKDACTTPSTSGAPTVQIARGRRATPTSAPVYADMLSTKLTIDANEYTSLDAAVPAVINVSNAVVALGDNLRFDVDEAGTGTKGLDVFLKFEEA